MERKEEMGTYKDGTAKKYIDDTVSLKMYDGSKWVPVKIEVQTQDFDEELGKFVASLDMEEVRFLRELMEEEDYLLTIGRKEECERAKAM